MYFSDGYRWFPIEDLPDVPLIRIFFFIDLEDLLLNVNRVCRRFYNLIKFTPTLWSIFEFYGPLVIKEEDLPYIFQHCRSFRVFNIGYSKYTGGLPAFDFSSVSKLSCARNLTWLNLCQTSISTTCFLQFMPNLEILDLSTCLNLKDCDFHAVSLCTKLDSLYISFNEISPQTIRDIVTYIPNIQVLDVCGIHLKYIHVINILDKCYKSLMTFYLSLDSTVHENDFARFMHFNYTDLAYTVYKPTQS